MPIDLTALNDPQRRAVLTLTGPLYTIAGPGSGKTRVLTHRIAHMLETGIAPSEILAITFTNKAAREMSSRVASLVSVDVRKMWICTFHSMCLRMLKASGSRIGIDRFVVYDEHDTKAVLNGVLDDKDLKEHRNAGKFRSLISNFKNDLVPPSEVVATMGNEDPQVDWAIVADVYAAYQERLKALKAMDFDDLLFYTHELLYASPAALAAYRDRFRYIMVDEHQDTNRAQYEIILALAQEHRNIMVVFDDDQSVYGFRGADVRNVQRFKHDFPAAEKVTLAQNYRSTQTIVAATSHMIGHNGRFREMKVLRSAGAKGEPIRVHIARDEQDEATHVVLSIAKVIRAHPGMRYSDVAVLYRTSAQSRPIESAMLKAAMPYVVVKGTAFFDRAEIKDAISILRVATTADDDVGLARMLTSNHAPKRGIGKETLRKITAEAMDQGLSLDEGLRQAALYAWDCVPTKTLRAIEPFLHVVDEMRRIASDEHLALPVAVERILERSGLLEALADGGEEGADRCANVRELASLVAEFLSSRTPDESNDLAAYLEWLALQGGELVGTGETTRLSAEAERDAVKMMTAHASKGLEFRMVVVVGMEEEFFPHLRALVEQKTPDVAQAEERRLAYVAMTRAKEFLFLTAAEQRMVAGNLLRRKPSRYIAEIPDLYLARTTAKVEPVRRPPPSMWRR